MSAVWIIILLNFAYLVRCQELIFANTVCRHGDRTIYKPYKTDKWANENFWPGGFGQLTNVGKRDQYKLGQYFRQRYRNLLGDGSYSAKKVYVDSTDSDRSIMSGLATLAGLFPPNEDERFIDDFDYHPIPIHTLPFQNDHLLATQRQCDRFDLEMQQFLQESYYKTLFKQHRKLIKYLEENSGSKIEKLMDITILYDALSIEKLKGLCLPKWAEKIMVPGGDFEYLALNYVAIQTSTNVMKKIKGGYLIKSIFDRLSNKTSKTLKPDRSLWMSFAHDITIVNLLSSLGVYNLHQPPYSCCVLFELYKDNDSHYMQVFYKKANETVLLELPRCGSKCTIDELYDIYRDILPTKPFDEECALRYGEVLAPNGNPESYTVIKI